MLVGRMTGSVELFCEEEIDISSFLSCTDQIRVNLGFIDSY